MPGRHRLALPPSLGHGRHCIRVQTSRSVVRVAIRSAFRYLGFQAIKIGISATNAIEVSSLEV